MKNYFGYSSLFSVIISSSNFDITCTDVITSQSDTINFGQVLISPNNLLTLNQSNTERYL
ncbi:MAG: hypothetical protein HW410_1275 [Nitrosarchaeum sp.]|nr:hypothetical protein [Nitrosarchaeum sp.]